jgi:hypothetical protein
MEPGTHSTRILVVDVMDEDGIEALATFTATLRVPDVEAIWSYFQKGHSRLGIPVLIWVDTTAMTTLRAATLDNRSDGGGTPPQTDEVS